MRRNNALMSRIAACSCNPCRALLALITEAKAELDVLPGAPGRLCEMAVVAAAGAKGLLSSEVVERRRAYQLHLGLFADGPLKNSLKPDHIKHAVKCSNHTPSVKPSQGPIHIGRAIARKVADRFFLTWEPVFVSTPEDSLPRLNEAQHPVTNGSDSASEHVPDGSDRESVV